MASSSAMAVDQPKPPKIDVEDYLNKASSSAPAGLQPYFESFKSLYQRKCDILLDIASSILKAFSLVRVRLWHQLTLKLLEFVDNPAAQPYRLDLFDKLVRDFETRLNQLRLVELGVKVSRDIDSTFETSHCIHSY
jgi:26S proteasome regulatory subunit N9